MRGGTLRVLSTGPAIGLDTAGCTSVARAYARTLYGYNLAGPPGQVTVPVPDIASGPPRRSADRRTYTFPCAPGSAMLPGQPRGRRHRLHHRHPAALRQAHRVPGKDLRRPDRPGQGSRSCWSTTPTGIPATDPLGKAWVDRIQVKLDVSLSSMQQQIEHEEADLALDSHVPETRLAALRADPERARRLSVNPSGTLRFLVLETNPKAGAIADVRVRQAVNHAIDKVAYRDAIAGSFAPPGSWPPPSCQPMRSATAATTSTRPRATGATPPRPRPCSPRQAIPTG
jgi:hypothetical protein